jgi:acetylornithine/N-succinyldiaminopimelate aminotransferase
MHLSQRQLFLQHQAQTTRFPLLLEFTKAEGIYLYNEQGDCWLDFISGISVSSLGHGNPRVKEAIKKQVDAYMHLMVYGEYVQAPQVQLAQLLTSILPPSLNCAYLVNSGAEATDGALKLAKRVTGRSKIIACKQAYHGSTHAALSLNSESMFTDAFQPLLPNIHFMTHGHLADLELIDTETACVVIEVIRSEVGYIPTDEVFLKAVRNRCSEMGAMLVIDEIQTGMGRTGKLFAFEHCGIIPDILLLGKALGAGMPIGAFVSSHERMMTLAEQPILGHITTFGGHPVVCAAAVAGIQELLSHNWIAEVASKEMLLRQRLQHPKIKSVSGKGLMLALEFENFDQNKRIIDACIANGLITDWFLFASNKLRITPPLIITEKQLHEACDILLEQIEKHA